MKYFLGLLCIGLFGCSDDFNIVTTARAYCQCHDDVYSAVQFSTGSVTIICKDGTTLNGPVPVTIYNSCSANR